MARRAAFTLADATPTQRAELFEHIDSAAGPTACWPWRGIHHTKGYPMFQGVLVRRLLPDAFPDIAPQVPPGLRNLRSTCGKVGCVNPSHMKTATPRGRKPARMEPFQCAVCGKDSERRRGSTRAHCSPACRMAAVNNSRELELLALLTEVDRIRDRIWELTIRQNPRRKVTP